MEKQARIDSLLRMIESKLHTYLDEQSKTTDPIEYEDRLLELGNQVMIEVLKDSRGKIPASRNGKKSLDENRTIRFAKIPRFVSK